MRSAEEGRERQAHDYGQERAGRQQKAAKIRRLIETQRDFTGAAVLDIGAGSGWMAAEWSDFVGPEGSVDAVDRFDQRETRAGFRFEQVDDTALPFDSDAFDIVISNHVLEHVGGPHDQRHHLKEIRRVLRPDGVAYLAVPNRWRFIEPHFHLPLLSWLTPKASDLYVRATGRGSWYDVVPPSVRTMAAMIDASGFAWRDVTLDSIAVMRETETMTRMHGIAARLPRPILRASHRFMPSLLYLLTHA